MSQQQYAQSCLTRVLVSIIYKVTAMDMIWQEANLVPLQNLSSTVFTFLQDSDALDGSTSSTQDTETGLSQDIRGASEGLLPGFSKLPDEKKEGAVLPKQSEVTIHEEPADSQVIYPTCKCSLFQHISA